MGLPKRDDTAGDYKQRILRVLDFLDENLDEDLNLARLAEVAAFSPFHFHHVFRGMAGESAVELVRRLRLERAWQRLRGSGASVANVALDSGYSAEESFIRAFKAQFGVTPGEARGQEPPHTGGLSALRLRVINFNARLGTVMDHDVREMTGFRVVGLGLDCPGFDGSGIGKLWGDLFCRMKELKPIGRMFGISLPRENGYYYIAGAEVAAADSVPEGMEEVQVPDARWFRVHFMDKAPKMSTAFGPIFSEMLPAAGLKPAESPLCLEDYPPDCMDEAAGTLKCDLYVQLAE